METEEHSRHQLLANILSSFGDLSRLHILNILRDGPTNVTEIVEKTNLSQPNVSAHLRCLRDCNLVISARQGRQVLYQFRTPKIKEFMDVANNLLDEVYNDVLTCRKCGDDN